MEAKVRELVELKKMAAELSDEITAIEDEIKTVMGDERNGSSRKVVGFWHIAFHHPARLRREKHGGEGDCSSCHAA